jgi:hypothetical protein
MRSAVQNGASKYRAPIGLLAELEKAHEELLHAIRTLEELARGPAPSRSELVNVRWKLSSASLSRRLLWGRIHRTLSGRVSQLEQDKLERLREADISLMRTSTQHVATWTPEAILREWSGYCSASRMMQRKMTDAIRAEQEILYPILSKM